MRLLTYKELSNELSLSVRYLQKCVQERYLPCIHFGRAVRFDPVKIAEWLDNRNQKFSDTEIKETA
jgi:excisionase family DNA binding protein